MNTEEKQNLVNSVPFWWHSIDLGGIITPGRKTPEILLNELECMQLPDLSGKSVLDIGAWDGFFSFEAERRGASRVLALDHYMWALDLCRNFARRRSGATTSPLYQFTEDWQPHLLPGKRGFDVAHSVLGSKVEQCVADFMTVDPVSIGSFDVVLFLGVLYHLENPLAGMRRLALFTRELAIVESHAVYVPEYENRSLWHFFPNAELDGGVDNWWVPNMKGITDICAAAGFRSVEVVSPYPPKEFCSQLNDYRITLHAYR